MFEIFDEMKLKFQKSLSSIPEKIDLAVNDTIEKKVVSPIASVIEKSVNASAGLFMACLTSTAQKIENVSNELIGAIDPKQEDANEKSEIKDEIKKESEYCFEYPKQRLLDNDVIDVEFEVKGVTSCRK